MNCKPNEMAIVTRGEPNADDYGVDLIRRLRGRIVKVLALHGDGIWTIEEPIILDNVPAGFLGSPITVLVQGIGDCYLTPLRGDPSAEDITEHVTDEVSA
jgi:hypothetical protein